MINKIRHESMRIAGKKVDTDKTIEVEYPYTGEIIGTVPVGTAEHAKNAFDIVSSVFNKYVDVKWITGSKVIYNERSEIIKYALPYKYRQSLIQVGAYGKNLPFIQQESTFWKKELLDLVDYKYLKTLKKSGDMYLWFCFSKKYKLISIETYLSGFKLFC